jgi:predicted negative regulator of RcsB-dependent stress response
MTKTGEAARPPVELDADSLLDTIRLRQREITIGVIALAVVAAVGWFWRSSVVQKEERGERALNLAANSYYSGNKALAKADLEKVADRYSGTPAGIQGVMLLAQVLYEDGQYDAGIKRLEGAKGSGGTGPFAASMEGLIAAGYSDEKKYDEAAKRYLAAADKAPFPGDKDLYRADAARVLVVAGKGDEARKIWADIATHSDSPALGEAKIRLGELNARPASKD